MGGEFKNVYYISDLNWAKTNELSQKNENATIVSSAKAGNPITFCCYNPY